MKAPQQAEHDGWKDGYGGTHRYLERWRLSPYWGDYLMGRDRGRADAEEEGRRNDES